MKGSAALIDDKYVVPQRWKTTYGHGRSQIVSLKFTFISPTCYLYLCLLFSSPSSHPHFFLSLSLSPFSSLTTLLVSLPIFLFSFFLSLSLYRTCLQSSAREACTWVCECKTYAVCMCMLPRDRLFIMYDRFIGRREITRCNVNGVSRDDEGYLIPRFVDDGTQLFLTS